MGDNPDELVCKTRIKLTPDFFGKMFLSKVSRIEEAIELLTLASNMHKNTKNWKKKGETFEELGLLDGESGGDMEYSYYQGSALCFS